MSKAVPAVISKPWLFFLASLGVVAAIVVCCLFVDASPEINSVAKPALSSSDAARSIDPKVIQMANEQIGWAQNESFARLDGHFAPVLRLFEAARTQEFAESCLSWNSKWLLLKDKVHDSGEHSRFIADAFRSLVLDHAELERLLEQCTKTYVQEVSSIDGEMLVRLQMDLASLPAGTVPVFDAGVVKSRYVDALHRSITASKSDVVATVEREAASFIVSEVVTAALVQLGVSGGILSTGAATGWTTFGAGLLVGVAVDYAVQQYTNPTGELTRDLDQRLKHLQSAILQGDDKSPGLIVRLREFAHARSIARRDAIHELLASVAAR